MPKEKINIMKMIGEGTAAGLQQEHLMRFEYIHYTRLVEHEKNHYHKIEDFEEFVDSIENLGLLQPLIVKPVGEKGKGIYVILAGHNRHKAIEVLVKKRKLEKFTYIPCFVVDRYEDEIISQFKIHHSNFMREKTSYDKMVACMEIEELLKKAKKKGMPIAGKLRSNVGLIAGIGDTQAQKYLTVAKQATEDVKKSLKEGHISILEAYDSTRPRPPEPEPEPEPVEADVSSDARDRELEKYKEKINKLTIAPSVKEVKESEPETPVEPKLSRSDDKPLPTAQASTAAQPFEETENTAKVALAKLGELEQVTSALNNATVKRLTDELKGELLKMQAAQG